MLQLFGNTKKAQKRKKEKTGTNKKVAKDDIVSELRSVSAEVISFKKITEGMVVLACIKQVTATFLNVQLPGRIFGTVRINSISEVYTQKLTKQIENFGGENDVSSSSRLKITQIVLLINTVYRLNINQINI